MASKQAEKKLHHNIHVNSCSRTPWYSGDCQKLQRCNAKLKRSSSAAHIYTDYVDYNHCSCKDTKALSIRETDQNNRVSTEVISLSSSSRPLHVLKNFDRKVFKLYESHHPGRDLAPSEKSSNELQHEWQFFPHRTQLYDSRDICSSVSQNDDPLSVVS